MMKIAFLSEGCLPIPPVKGGAVGELVKCLVDENGKDPQYQMCVYSIYDKDLSEYRNNKSYKFIRTGIMCKIFDYVIYRISKVLLGLSAEKYRYICQRLEYLLLLRMKLLRDHYDLVVLEANTTLLSVVGMLKRKQSKVVFHLHNDVPTIYGRKDTVCSLDGIIGNSEYVINSFFQHYNIDNNVRKYILKNCLTNLFEDDIDIDIRAKYGIDCDDQILLYVGRLTKQKGVLELIKAFKKVKGKVVLLIVGSPLFGLSVKNEYMEKIEAEIKESHQRIKLTGYVPNNMLGPFYRQAELSVFPSLYGEAAGLTVIEALANGTRVITTGVGGICEYVNEKEVVIVRPGDEFEDRLAEEINKQLEMRRTDPEKKDISMLIKERYSKKAYFDNFVTIVEEVFD